MLEDPHDGQLDLGPWCNQAAVPDQRSIANARQQIGNRVGHLILL
jgi:hypothetical protein